MALENLKSIFNQNVGPNNRGDFKETPMKRHTFGGLLPSEIMLNPNILDFPLLDTILIQPPFFVSEDLLTKHYENMYFDPRPPKNDGITISNINPYQGTQNIATNPTDFSTAGTGLGMYTPYSIPFQPPPGTSFGIEEGGNFITTTIDTLTTPMIPGTSPILDNILIKAPFFVSEDLQSKYFEDMLFDPRAALGTKPRTTISNINPYQGTQYKATNPTDFSNAGIGDGVYTPNSIPLIPAPSTIFGDDAFNTTTTDVYANKLELMQTPILDTLWPNQTSPPQSNYTSDFFIDDINSLNNPYNYTIFDPRTPKNSRITITKHTYSGTIYKATNPTDFSTAGMEDNNYTPLSQYEIMEDLQTNELGELGLTLAMSNAWEALYNPDHTPKLGDELSDNLGPFTAYHYSQHVSREKLNIRHNENSTSFYKF